MGLELKLSHIVAYGFPVVADCRYIIPAAVSLPAVDSSSASSSFYTV